MAYCVLHNICKDVGVPSSRDLVEDDVEMDQSSFKSWEEDKNQYELPISHNFVARTRHLPKDADIVMSKCDRNVRFSLL